MNIAIENQLTYIEEMENIFHQSYGKLCLFAKKLLEDDIQVEDIVQDVFLKLLERKEIIDYSNKEALLGYLYIAVKNACFKHHRRQKVIQTYHEKNIFELSENPAIFKEIIQAEAISELYNAIQELPSGCMQILKKSVFDGMSNAEIASDLDLSIHTIKSQKRRAMQLLKNRLKPDINLLILLFII